MGTPAVAFANITYKIASELISACLRRYPHEACGVLFGDQTDGVVRVTGFALVRNAAFLTGRAFSFHPADWTAALLRAQKNRQTIVGLFHSHPDEAATPSEEDGLGADSSAVFTYWIVGAASQESDPEIAAYRRLPLNGWSKLALVYSDS